jgi:hypothetical protein
VRKSHKKAEVERLVEEAKERRIALDAMVKAHDEMVIGYRTLNAELSQELRLYTWAFSIACGKLMAYTKTPLTVDEFTAEMLDEAKKELEGL